MVTRKLIILSVELNLGTYYATAMDLKVVKKTQISNCIYNPFVRDVLVTENNFQDQDSTEFDKEFQSK